MRFSGQFSACVAMLLVVIGRDRPSQSIQQNPPPSQATKADSKTESTPAAPLTKAEVPFVGCPSDGQAGPQDAPSGNSMVLPITAAAAQQLAYYKARDGIGVLAPRGWHCLNTYGSGGAGLFVSPEPITFANLVSSTWTGFAGPAVDLGEVDAGTSGRFVVAHAIARVFPAHKSFVESVIAEGIEPEGNFPFGPYPTDKLTYRGSELVEYETPANTNGLGTDFGLTKNARPIKGMALLLGQELDLTELAVRLPASQDDLTPVIIQQAERDATQTAAEP